MVFDAKNFCEDARWDAGVCLGGSCDHQRRFCVALEVEVERIGEEAEAAKLLADPVHGGAGASPVRSSGDILS